MKFQKSKNPLNGLVKQYYANGELASETSFKNGKKHGKWEIYKPKGSLHSITNFINGKKAGV